jgi:hypothetical protein
MTHDAGVSGDFSSRVDLGGVALAIAEGERVDIEPFAPGDREYRRRVEPSTQENDGRRR